MYRIHRNHRRTRHSAPLQLQSATTRERILFHFSLFVLAGIDDTDGWLNGTEKNSQGEAPEKSSVVAVTEVTSTGGVGGGGGGGGSSGGGGAGSGSNSGGGGGGGSGGSGVGGHKNPSLKDFPKAVKRLLKNDILLFRTASSVLHILPVAGFYTFLPKYLESQFRLAAHVANMISGNL